ncbi:hypothetical protein ACFXGI_26115 [Streptomyces sp. NPDC059355]|uniref:hypothetical protein n=1 Tax=Streptomyces sp. NPDC059355 TaxID=3346811 RepID=UPI00369A4A8D
MHRTTGVTDTTPPSAAVATTPNDRVPVVLPELVRRLTAEVELVTDARRVTDRLPAFRDHRLSGEPPTLIDREAPLVFRFDAAAGAWRAGGDLAYRPAVPLRWRTSATAADVGAGSAGAGGVGTVRAGGVGGASRAGTDGGVEVATPGKAAASSSGEGRSASGAGVDPMPSDVPVPDQERSRRAVLSERLGRAWASSRATARFHHASPAAGGGRRAEARDGAGHDQLLVLQSHLCVVELVCD